MGKKIPHFLEYFPCDFTLMQIVSIETGAQEISRGSVNFQHH